MKQKQSSPSRSELRGIDFISPMKSNEKGVSLLSISLEGDDVKGGLESAMTLLFQLLSEVDRLQREAREGRDG